MVIRLLLLFVLFPYFSNSQSVTVGRGTYSGSNVYGPLFSTTAYDSAYSRHAFIYPASVLTGLKHGDTISSLEFYAEADQPMSGKLNFKIYLKMVKSDTFSGSNINWKNEKNSSGVVLVYDNNPVSLMDGSSGFKNFIFNINKFRFDTTGGKVNLELIMSYDQQTKQASNTYWLYENNFSVSAFKNRNEGKFTYGRGVAPDTTRLSDLRKPHIRINFPRYSKNLNIVKTYCLGKVPLLAGVNDSVKVLVSNRGKRNVTKTKLYLNISGANSHIDSLNIASLVPWEERIFTFGKFKPDSSGDDRVIVALANDDFIDDNFDTILRKINYNVFSHADPNQGNAGGIGFSGSTGDFVAKFFSDTGVFINQVSVDFSASGRGFRVGIWDDDAKDGFPRTVLFMSDSLTSKGGTYILPVLPRVKVSGGFYVGIRQNTGTNVAFSFQDEDPIRPGAFYFTAPMGNTVWTPFSPGFPYKFNIQPRIQVANDVSPIAIVYPSGLNNIDYSIYDSIGPVATIINYGFNDQTTPFEIECKITDIYNTEEYKSVRYITLNAGQSKTVYFDTAFRLYNLGTHKITITTKLAKDKIVDNNILSQTFRVTVKHDIGVDLMFTPMEGGIYEFKRDTFLPTVRINNYGTLDKNNFKVTFRIRDGSKIIHSETLTKSLAAGNQTIITFSEYVPITVGNYVAECFTSLKDSIPFNDTVRNNIEFQKSNDVGPIRIDVPLPASSYAMGGFFFAKLVVKNFGIQNQLAPFRSRMYVYGTKGQLLFEDTASNQLGAFSETQLTFKRFNIPNVFGKYKVFFRTELSADQEPVNDTLTVFFTVVPNRDLSVLKLLLPGQDTVISSEQLPIKPVVIVKNNGSLNITSIGPVYIQIYQNSILIYQDSATITGNLSFKSELNIVFKKDFLTSNLGNFTSTVFCRYAGDLVPSNDTFLSRFKINRNFDLALDSITNFNNGHVFEYDKSYFKPQIILKNNGSTSYPTSFSIILEIFKNGTTLIETNILKFDSMKRFDINSIFQDSLINLKQIGDFTLCATLIATLDDNLIDNKYCWNYIVEKSLDLALDSILFPDKSNYCYKDKTYRPVLKASNFGTKPITNTLVDLKVYETTNFVWWQSIYIDLNPGETKWIKFDSTLNFSFTGSAWARAIGYLSADKEKGNDTSIRTFQVSETSGNKTFMASSYRIYPNPSNGVIFIETINNSEITVSIINLTGQTLFKQNIHPIDQKIEINLREDLIFSKGIYFIRLRNDFQSQIFKVLLD